jgi:peptidoglycan/xylan/chitin deacetylase (PgdA/CDA1 family)
MVHRVDGYGPQRLPSALVLTLDNLGEASALERGELKAATGRDPSVTEVLPWLLGELDRHELKATFFVEAINCELYPEAVAGIAARGHELGHHGWSHEAWAELSAHDEGTTLARGIEAFESLGLHVRGFRPPGGELTPSSPTLLREHGLRWCSPAGGDARTEDGLVYVPFDWGMVDAYYLMDSFRGLRAARGEPEAPTPPAALAARLQARLAGATGCEVLILHPFLMLDDAWAAGVSDLLASVERLVRDGRSWVVPGGVFADWLSRTVG